MTAVWTSGSLKWAGSGTRHAKAAISAVRPIGVSLPPRAPLVSGLGVFKFSVQAWNSQILCLVAPGRETTSSNNSPTQRFPKGPNPICDDATGVARFVSQAIIVYPKQAARLVSIRALGIDWQSGPVE